MESDATLVPIVVSSGKAVRTPVEVVGSGYTVCVGDYTYRHFTEGTAPMEIKSLLGMVKAFPKESRMVSTPYGAGHYVPPDPRLKDIGWQLYPDKEWFILVISNITFNLIRASRGGNT